MESHTVYVSLKGEGSSKKLRLRDSQGHIGDGDLTTNVDVNDLVQWVVDPAPPNGARPIHSIEKVYKKPVTGNISLLTDEPANIGGGVWQGRVVSTSPGRGKQQKYNIDYKESDADRTETCDPKLQMN